jgi:hypothetical protein
MRIKKSSVSYRALLVFLRHSLYYSAAGIMVEWYLNGGKFSEWKRRTAKK